MLLRVCSWLLDYGCGGVVVGERGRVIDGRKGFWEGLGGMGERVNWVGEQDWERHPWRCTCRWRCPSIVIWFGLGEKMLLGIGVGLAHFTRGDDWGSVVAIGVIGGVVMVVVEGG